MQATLSQAIERCLLDLDRFLEVWPLLTSRDLLQALEACSGKTIHLFAAGTAPERIEILVDCDAGRAAVDTGTGARWGRGRPAVPARAWPWMTRPASGVSQRCRSAPRSPGRRAHSAT